MPNQQQRALGRMQGVVSAYRTNKIVPLCLHRWRMLMADRAMAEAQDRQCAADEAMALMCSQAMAEVQSQSPAKSHASIAAELESAMKTHAQSYAEMEDLRVQLQHCLTREAGFLEVVEELKATVAQKDQQLASAQQELRRDASERTRVIESVQILEKQLLQVQQQGSEIAEAQGNDRIRLLEQKLVSQQTQLEHEKSGRKLLEERVGAAQREKSVTQEENERLRSEMQAERYRFMELMQHAENMLDEASNGVPSTVRPPLTVNPALHHPPAPPEIPRLAPAPDPGAPSSSSDRRASLASTTPSVMTTPRGFGLRKELEHYKDSIRSATHRNTHPTNPTHPQPLGPQSAELHPRPASFRRGASSVSHSANSVSRVGPDLSSCSPPATVMTPVTAMTESSSGTTADLYLQARRTLMDLRGQGGSPTRDRQASNQAANQAAFERMDTNKDGVIDGIEFQRGMNSHPHPNPEFQRGMPHPGPAAWQRPPGPSFRAGASQSPPPRVRAGRSASAPRDSLSSINDALSSLQSDMMQQEDAMRRLRSSLRM